MWSPLFYTVSLRDVGAFSTSYAGDFALFGDTDFMTMTAEQLAALKADIDATPELSSQPLTPDGHLAIAAAYNEAASPLFLVWRTAVGAQEITGSDGFAWSVVDNLTAGKARIWDWLTRFDVFDPSRPNVRAGLQEAFGASPAMVNAIVPILRRPASRAEELFATGSGTGGSTATLTFEGAVTAQDVETARNLP